MTKEFKELLEKAKQVVMTPSEKEAQRRSFAYGNTRIENRNITRETIDRAAEALKNKNGTKD